MKKKKVFLSTLILALVIAVGVLSAALYHANQSLDAAQADIDGMAFVEGKVVQNKEGGVVTASFKTWVYFEDDSFVTSSKPQGKPLAEIFCELHESGHMTSFNASVAKLKFSKQITLKVGDAEKSFYYVGGYYITSK